MKTQIKICGIKKVEELYAAAKHGASHVGFVHFEKSPRHVDTDQIMQLCEVAENCCLETVVLLVDPKSDTLQQFWQRNRPHIIQLHGNETPKEIVEMRNKFPFKYWKAIGVRTIRHLGQYVHYNYDGTPVNRILFDAMPPKGFELPGGNGLRIDWQMFNTIPQIEHRVGPWGLAGGLTPHNVAEAIRITGAPLVDVSSGVESAPGIKDVDKIAAFCQAVRNL